MAPRILYLSRWFPDPPDNGAKLRTWHNLEALAAAGYEITLLSYYELGHAPIVSDELRRMCGHIETFPRTLFQPDSWRALTGFLSTRPRSLVDTYSAEMGEAVDREVRGGGYALAVVTTIDMTAYTPWLGVVPLLLDEVEPGHYREGLRQASAAKRARAWLTWSKLRRYLRRVLPRYSACVPVSHPELELLRRTVPDHGGLHVIENSVDASGAPQTERNAKRLVFAGSLTYEANRDAMQWFCNQILPRIRTEIPGVEVAISGALPAGGFPAPAEVQLLGWVDDVRALVASSAVSLAPIRHGGGSRLKILEAMALGTPVVATSKGAEGLAVVHGEHLLIGNHAEVFADHVVRLLRHAELRQRLADAARKLVAMRYDNAIVGRQFTALVDSIIANGHVAERARA